MIYNNRTYPHPVLGIEDDVNGSLETGLKISSDGVNILIMPTFSLLNQDLERLLKDDSVSYSAHVYCRGTMYREVFSSKTSIPEPIRIPAVKLSGEVEADFFICCNKKDLVYQSEFFNKEYGDFKFLIDRGDIMAYAGKAKFFANKTFENLTAVSALMNVDNSNESQTPMYNYYDGEKITIMLCKEEYQNYQIIKSQSYWINILLSSVVFPAILEALHFMEDVEVSKEFENKRWFKTLERIKNDSNESNNLKIAQNILNLPMNRTFENLKKLMED